jgi:hypothetical protein
MLKLKELRTAVTKYWQYYRTGNFHGQYFLLEFVLTNIYGYSSVASVVKSTAELWSTRFQPAVTGKRLRRRIGELATWVRIPAKISDLFLLIEIYF